MAKCPTCKTKQPYLKQFRLLSRKVVTCVHCGALLKVDKVRMLPFYIFFNSFAGLFGLAMTISGDYKKWISVLVIWIMIMLAMYPLVLRIKIANQK